MTRTVSRKIIWLCNSNRCLSVWNREISLPFRFPLDFMLSDSRFGTPFPFFRSLRGRRLKGKGKGVLDARETRGAREEALVFLSRLKLPFPSPPNTCHAGYRRSKGKGKGIRVPDHARGKKITKITQLWMTSWQISLAPMHVVFLALFCFCFPKTRLNFRRLPGPVFDPPRRETLSVDECGLIFPNSGW